MEVPLPHGLLVLKTFEVRWGSEKGVHYVAEETVATVSSCPTNTTCQSAFHFGAVQPSRAAGALASVTDYHIPSGLGPWGTAYDSRSNAWVAIPDCNPNPDCGSKTPPGKIEVFNPATSSWIATYQLPANFGQPLFSDSKLDGKADG